MDVPFSRMQQTLMSVDGPVSDGTRSVVERGGEQQHHGAAAAAVLGAAVLVSFRSVVRQCRLGTQSPAVLVGSRGAAASVRGHQGLHHAAILS